MAAASVPVVFATGSDPVAAHLIASLNRPGGNLTGFTVITAALWPKRLELLRELIWPTPMIALLVNPSDIDTIPSIRELNDAARMIGQDMMVINAGAEREFEPASAGLTEGRAGALVVADDELFAGRRAKAIELAARHAVPAIYGRRGYPDAGGLIRRCEHGRPVLPVRVLCWPHPQGGSPGELPFLQPSKFELVLDLKPPRRSDYPCPRR